MTDLKNEKCSLSTIPIKSQVSNQARKFDQLLIASPSLLSSVFAEIQELRRETEERIDALTRDCEFHQQSSKLEKLKTKEDESQNRAVNKKFVTQGNLSNVGKNVQSNSSFRRRASFTEDTVGLKERSTSPPPKTSTAHFQKAVTNATTRNPPRSVETGAVANTQAAEEKKRAQVPIQTFWNSVEPYFRPLTENDLRFLEGDPEDDVGPFLTPTLGKHYSEVWTEEDRQSSKKASAINSASSILKEGVIKYSHDLEDEHLLNELAKCGPLTQRIVSALLKDELTTKLIDPATITSTPVPPVDFISLEERLKRELKSAGFLESTEIDWKSREDDEICVELRSLQKHLRTLAESNKKRKRLVSERVRDHIAYQEFTQIVEDLDRNVEANYIKRRAKSKKKRPSGSASGSVQFHAGNSRNAIDRRRKFIQGISKIFPPQVIDTANIPLFPE